MGTWDKERLYLRGGPVDPLDFDDQSQVRRFSSVHTRHLTEIFLVRELSDEYIILLTISVSQMLYELVSLEGVD